MKAKLEELKQKKTELEKAQSEETNGQKKGGITRSLNAVIKEIESLEASGDPDSDDGDQSDAGYGTEAGQAGEQKNEEEETSEEEDLISVTVQSKTGQKYRRLGMAFTKNAAPVKVTAEQLEALKKDPWLKVVEIETEEAAE